MRGKVIHFSKILSKKEREQEKTLNYEIFLLEEDMDKKHWPLSRKKSLIRKMNLCHLVTKANGKYGIEIWYDSMTLWKYNFPCM